MCSESLYLPAVPCVRHTNPDNGKMLNICASPLHAVWHYMYCTDAQARIQEQRFAQLAHLEDWKLIWILDVHYLCQREILGPRRLVKGLFVASAFMIAASQLHVTHCVPCHTVEWNGTLVATITVWNDEVPMLLPHGGAGLRHLCRSGHSYTPLRTVCSKRRAEI